MVVISSEQLITLDVSYVVIAMRLGFSATSCNTQGTKAIK